MARPTKNDIDYFSFNVNFFDDTKILFVSSKYEEIGELVTVKLLCWIYKTDGYYTDWNEEISMLFAKKSFSNIKSNVVNDIVKELLKRGFFNKHLFEKYGILTSRGIQKRWIEATKRRKVEMINEYDLVNFCSETDTENTLNDTETTLKPTGTNPQKTVIEPKSTETTQSKVKESKVYKSKVEESIEKETSDFNYRLIDIDLLPVEYLQNKRIVNAVLSNKKNKFRNLRHLEKRLIEFKNHLTENGVFKKTMADFSSHFRYWHIGRSEKQDEVSKVVNKIPIG